jgi:hypothetical protein
MCNFEGLSRNFGMRKNFSLPLPVSREISKRNQNFSINKKCDVISEPSLKNIRKGEQTILCESLNSKLK